MASTQSFSRAVLIATGQSEAVALLTAQAFSLTDMLYGRIFLPSGANTALVFYECDTIDGTYHRCEDVGTNGSLTVTTAASIPRSVAIPSVLMGSRFVKITSNVVNVTATIITKT